MFVVYENDTKLVLAVSKANSRGASITPADVSVMYPNVDTSCVEADFPQVKPGYRIVLEDTVPVAVVSPDGTEYRLPNSDIEQGRKALFESRMNSVKYRIDGNFHCLFGVNGILRKMRQLDEDTISSIEDGSFFSNLSPVGWWGSFLDAGGYANMNREIVSHLPNHGFLPVTDIYPTVTQVGKETERLLKLLSMLRPVDGRYTKVYAFTPMPHPRHPGKSVFFTMMETATLHPDFSRYCNIYSDEVWVPSAANAELFRQGGVRKSIKVVPLGIDIGLYSRPVEYFDLGACKSLYGRPVEDGICGFKFLTVIQWNMRKGYDALLKAYIRAFGAADNVCLVIATQYSEETVRGSLDKYLERKTDLPQVILYNDIVPIDKMPYLYDACNCYVHLSRGEGFSLTQIEAAARGLPVISCLHSGMAEYLRDDNSFPVRCPSTENCPTELAAISYFYQGQKLWKVGDGEVDQAAAHMRHVYGWSDDVVGKAAALQKEVFERYTWKSAVSRVADLLR
jgi:glycosyltransferase involved in cell wall biosynthesis